MIAKPAEIDPHPDQVSSPATGYVLGESIRRFAEPSSK
jgi:hypothetical protein